jgi:phenylalanyl-tRNA synthetase beta chain
MKFTPAWLRDHLETDATVPQLVDAMTAAGLEVEHVDDPVTKLAPFSVAKIVSAVKHPDADKLQVCQVETKDGLKEIVCGAPNARAGLTTIYAPVGAYVPGLGVTLSLKPVRGVVSNGMLCSGKELEVAEESDGILELPDQLAVGVPAATVFGAEPAIDFEVTPNRPDWLGVQGIARDLAAAGVGRFKDQPITPVAGAFPCPISVEITALHMAPFLAGRVIRGLRNGPSPEWLVRKLASVGQRSINALVDITNYLTLDRARPLHAYDAGKFVGSKLVVRQGLHGVNGDEHLIVLGGDRIELTPSMCVIADADGERPIDLAGVKGGESTGCTEATTEVFLEAAWFEPNGVAETGRALALFSDAQYRFARGVDPGFVLPGLELATRLILDLCGGEASEVIAVGELPAAPVAFDFDPDYVRRLSGLDVPADRVKARLEALGFVLSAGEGGKLRVQPPTWRRDVEGPADLVEEVARLEGFGALPSTPLPEVPAAPQGVLSRRQARVRAARRALAAFGYAETVGWSFTSQRNAALFGGGDKPELTLINPISSELSVMRPSALPGLVEAAARNAARGFPDAALFEIGPVFPGDQPQDQRTVVTVLIAPNGPRRWDKGGADPLFQVKADLEALLAELGAPPLQLAQGAASAWWRPGQSARLQLGPKVLVAEFGALHPRVLKAMDVDGPLYAFTLDLSALPEPKQKAVKTRANLALSPLMPLTRDFAFVVDAAKPAGDLTRAIAGADKSLIAEVRVFDVYAGPGVAEGSKSVAVEVVVQPREATLTDAEIEALSGRIVAAAQKLGAQLRS